jgi:hypothetical protein
MGGSIGGKYSASIAPPALRRITHANGRLDEPADSFRDLVVHAERLGAVLDALAGDGGAKTAIGSPPPAIIAMTTKWKPL